MAAGSVMHGVTTWPISSFRSLSHQGLSSSFFPSLVFFFVKSCPRPVGPYTQRIVFTTLGERQKRKIEKESRPFFPSAPFDSTRKSPNKDQLPLISRLGPQLKKKGLIHIGERKKLLFLIAIVTISFFFKWKNGLRPGWVEGPSKKRLCCWCTQFAVCLSWWVLNKECSSMQDEKTDETIILCYLTLSSCSLSAGQIQASQWWRQMPNLSRPQHGALFWIIGMQMQSKLLQSTQRSEIHALYS